MAYPERKVLVVDDHDQIRSLIVDYVDSESGYTVVGEAVNGEEAIRMAAELQPDLIFMDISMPVMSGVEAIQVIKERHPSIRIIIVTIHEGQMYHTIADRLHVDGYISKNSFVADLRAVLRKLK